MTKRGAGVSFIGISAFLISSKYISAAIFGSGVSFRNEVVFDNMMEYIGSTLSNYSIFTLIIGIVYMLWGEYDARITRASSIESTGTNSNEE